VHAEENASSCPTLLARNTWYDCSTIGYALQPRSQRAFQSRQISRMPWEEKAGLPDRRQVVVLPAPGQDGSGRNWATNPPNRSRTPPERGHCLPGHAGIQSAASSQGVAILFSCPIGRYGLDDCLA